jgi:hypothetical protein
MGMQLMNRLLFGMTVSACLLMAQADPPGRVARMSYMSGSVSFRPGDVDDWAAADFNRPLTTGDHIWVDEGGRAELQIGSAALRIGPRTALELLNLDDSTAQIRVTEGSLNIRLRYLGDQATVEVDTPNLAFSLLRTGEYRVDVNPDSYATSVIVRAGEGEVTGSNQAFPVHAGEEARVTGSDSPSFETVGAPPRDEWDAWCGDRDRRDDRSPSARYVSREMVGYQDLDEYGSWRDTPDYGAVWVPSGTPVGWAPYHYGHWVWVDPWGWTWVDDAPWGFAPFHYGRWAYVGGYWGWVPGPVAVRPVYAPALVAWVGGGAIGGGVAWFALGPREVYVPAYRTSPVYINRVNVTNTVIVNNNVNITNINTTNVTYVNRSAPGAVMAVQQNAFASARPVQSAAITVRPEAVRSAPVMASASVAPSRESVVRMAAPGARVAQPPAAVQSRSVIAKQTPPPPPVPFAQKQQALAANAGRPLDTNQVQQIRQNQPAAARPFVRQVQAQSPPAQSPAQSAPAGQFNRPAGQVPPQRTPVAPSPVTPSPAAPEPTIQRPTPPQRSADVPPRTFDRGNDRPPQNQPVQREVTPPTPQRQAPPPPPPPSREVQRPAPAENRPAPAENRPAPREVAPPQQQRQAPPPPPPPSREAQRPAPAENRPAPREVAPPQQQRQAPPPPPPSREAQRPAPAENRPAPAENRPARPAPKDEKKKEDH